MPGFDPAVAERVPDDPLLVAESPVEHVDGGAGEERRENVLHEVLAELGGNSVEFFGPKSDPKSCPRWHLKRICMHKLQMSRASSWAILYPLLNSVQKMSLKLARKVAQYWPSLLNCPPGRSTRPRGTPAAGTGGEAARRRTGPGRRGFDWLVPLLHIGIGRGIRKVCTHRRPSEETRKNF